MTDRLELRELFRQGILDKHAYSKAILVKHAVLAEYSALLSGSDIKHIEINSDGVWLHSSLAPICVELDLLDRGTPGMAALNFGNYERTEFNMWRRLVPSAASIADIGASIGWYSAHWAALDSEARVIAFEPVPSTFRGLQRTVSRNRLSNITAEPLGVSEKDGKLEIFVDPSIAGAASAHPSVYAATSNPVCVQVIQLDNYASQHNLHFDALKIDVEGGELAVLKGATQVITRDRPILLVEMLRRHARAFGYHPNDIIAFMKPLGYRCYFVNEDHLLEFTQMDEETIETNFFFIHESKGNPPNFHLP
jgi:FkbM family methyltransferase